MTAERRTFSSCSSISPTAAVLPWPEQQQRKLGWHEPNDALCYKSTPHPGRRRSSVVRLKRQQRAGSRSCSSSQILLLVVLVILSCGKAAVASNVIGGMHDIGRSELLFDRSEPPAQALRLRARQETTRSLPASIEAPTSSNPASSSSQESTPLNTATPTSQSILPSPFDSSLGNNFTSPSCPAFFQGFLANDTFNDCLPFSLLLQTSNGFFVAERSLPRLTQTLDATCNVNYDTCSTLMQSLAAELQDNSKCGADLQMQNPTVMQAYNGFLSYKPLYHAGCLTDTEGNYCFANAVTNSSAPTSSYIYYLPLGVQLPAGTRPACNMCLQNTMAIFATAASNSSVPLSEDYTLAAQQVDMGCGPTFVEASVGMNSAASPLKGGSLGLSTFALVLLFINAFL